MASGSEELVRETIAQLREAADSGDPTALADLSAKSGSRAATSPALATPEPDVMVSPERIILRPNGEGYHVRKIGIHDDVCVLQRSRALNKHNILLVGYPGTGKTALIEAAYAEGPVYTVQGTGDTMVDDLVGGHVQDPNTGIFTFILGPLPRAMVEGRPLYIDEIALIDPKVTALAYSVMDGRNKLRITQAPELTEPFESAPGFYIIGATNPNAPGARMSEALLSRFDVQVEVTTDFKLAKAMGVDSKMITAAQNLARKREESDISWSPQMRELLAFRDLSKEYGTDFALRNMIGTAPEMDRVKVQGVISRQFARPLRVLTVD